MKSNCCDTTTSTDATQNTPREEGALRYANGLPVKPMCAGNAGLPFGEDSRPDRRLSDRLSRGARRRPDRYARPTGGLGPNRCAIISTLTHDGKYRLNEAGFFVENRYGEYRLAEARFFVKSRYGGYRLDEARFFVKIDSDYSRASKLIPPWRYRLPRGKAPPFPRRCAVRGIP